MKNKNNKNVYTFVYKKNNYLHVTLREMSNKNYKLLEHSAKMK